MGTRYSQITEADRLSIQAMTLAQFSVKSIAEKLDFHVSSIYRELNRGKADETSSASGYRAVRAHDRARNKRIWAGVGRRKLGFDLKTPLWKTVIDGLRSRWSPQQIAGKLPRMNQAACQAGQSPASTPLSVSHETIYCAIYAMPRTTLRSELVALLHKSHKHRIPRARGTVRKAGGIPNVTNIALRLPEVAARIVPDHWEGDLIKGANNQSEPHRVSRRPVGLSQTRLV